jgi:LPS-assembly protein
MLRTCLLLLIVLAASALPAWAQAQPGGCSYKWAATSQTAQNMSDTGHTILVRDVHIDCNDIQLFADEVELISDADRLRATGNVVFVSNNNRISADRMDFNTRTKTGTFYNASGIANLENRGVDRSFFGTQEPDAYFFGQTIEKLGPRTYRVEHGGFTTCVQPTPRWEFVATSVTLTLEKHALLTNALLKVKDVPVFYLPALYYPINKEDRATGFLIPVYGKSTIKGQSISNAFFWAINRSEDATFYHSYYSKTGQSFGTQYRYVQSAASSGNAEFDMTKEHAATYDQPDGSEKTIGGVDSYNVNGSMTQALPLHLRSTASASYFSSLVAEQRYQQNITQATNRNRTFGGNVIGSWGADTLSTTIQRNEVFTNNTDSIVTGSLPRLNFSRAEKAISDSIPIYYGTTAEYAGLVRTDKTETQTNDQSLSRVDFSPTIRFPYTKLSFLSINSSMGFHETYWTQSLDDNHQQVPDGIQRHYFNFTSTITGPVFSRIFDSPGSTYAQKWKHVIEPTFSIQRTTAIDNRSHIVPLEGSDQTVGGVTSMTYGVNNRLYAKKESAREIVTVSLSQTYYSVAAASTVDQQYQSSSFSTTPAASSTASNFSPVALQVHVSPTNATDASARIEYDAHNHSLRQLSVNGGASHGWVSSSTQWSVTKNPPVNIGDKAITAQHFLNQSTIVRKPGNAFSGSYNFNLDVLNGKFVNQTVIAHYNTQCCGIAVEYQKFDFGTQAGAVGVPKDHRFNLSFTLAGIGTFSDLFGAFGGQQGR